MKHTKHITMIVVAILLTIALLPAGIMANSRNAKKNLAIGLGVASLYSLGKGNTGTGLLLGAGSWYEYNQYKKSNKKHCTYKQWQQRHRTNWNRNHRNKNWNRNHRNKNWNR